MQEIEILTVQFFRCSSVIKTFFGLLFLHIRNRDRKRITMLVGRRNDEREERRE
jgi:hypothetical protein